MTQYNMTDYKGVKVAITGHTGFIGKILADVLELQEKAEVIRIEGDVRDPDTFYAIDHSVKYLFHFGAPSSQILFKRSPLYCADVTINGFLNAVKACQMYGAKLIYPSTGLLSNKSQNEYARCKLVQEQIHIGENLNALGLRIFASYGPTEGHKGEYASVPYLFTKQVLADERPVIFGSGGQSRDFIYVGDVVNAILGMAQKVSGIVDVGSAKSTTFNELLSVISEVTEKLIDPEFVPKPENYIEKTIADEKSHQYYKAETTLKEGITNIVNHLKPRL